jgi:hypothetical protein
MVDLHFVFAIRLSGRTVVLPMLIAISLGPTFLVYRVPVRFLMVFDQSSSVQPVISVYALSKEGEEHTTRRSFH